MEQIVSYRLQRRKGWALYFEQEEVKFSIVCEEGGLPEAHLGLADTLAEHSKKNIELDDMPVLRGYVVRAVDAISDGRMPPRMEIHEIAHMADEVHGFATC